MPILKIVTVPNKILKTPAKLVTTEQIVSEDFAHTVQNLIDTMYSAEGIGIAAPQVGISQSVCIIAKDAVPGKKSDLVLINPKIERISRSTNTDTEGCLSIPKIYGEVKRPKDIRVHATDTHGHTISFDAHDFFARVIQHEVDHLNGILFVERAKKMYKIEDKKNIPITISDIII